MGIPELPLVPDSIAAVDQSRRKKQLRSFFDEYGSEEGRQRLAALHESTQKDLETWENEHPIEAALLDTHREIYGMKSHFRKDEDTRELQNRKSDLLSALYIDSEQFDLFPYATDAERAYAFAERSKVALTDEKTSTLIVLYQGDRLFGQREKAQLRLSFIDSHLRNTIK